MVFRLSLLYLLSLLLNGLKSTTFFGSQLIVAQPPSAFRRVLQVLPNSQRVDNQDWRIGCNSWAFKRFDRLWRKIRKSFRPVAFLRICSFNIAFTIEYIFSNNLRMHSNSVEKRSPAGNRMITNRTSVYPIIKFLNELHCMD